MALSHPYFNLQNEENLNFNVDFSALESNNTILKSKKGKIPANTDVKAWLENSTLLTNQNSSGFRYLTAKKLNASIFRVTVASVACRALSFFMCHVSTFK